MVVARGLYLAGHLFTLYFHFKIDKSTLIGASENEVKGHARMETEQYGYEIYALKRSFGSLKGNLEFPMEIKGSK